MPSFTVFGAPVVLLSKIGDVEIDAVEEVTVTAPSLVAENPTETGINVSDHIVNMPVSIRMTGRFVDTPLAGFGGQAAFFNPAQAIASAIASGLQGGRSQAMWQALEAIRQNKVPVDVFIQQGEYTNLAVKSLSAPRRKGDGGSQRFQIDLQEIITAEAARRLDLAGFGVDQSVQHTGKSVRGEGVQGAQQWTPF